ncbi:MAG: hypothetical protein IPQ08_13605 [Chitinophagaceae bacterium]|nr:hypothetical protein [Chitinophagaceae bacterium]
MRIHLNGFTAEELHEETRKGGKFVYYSYAISLLVVTLNRTSGIFLIKAGESGLKKGIPYTIISFLLGWWAFPFGPKHTLASIRMNLKGGKDVTDEVDSIIAGHLLFKESQVLKKAVSNV